MTNIEIARQFALRFQEDLEQGKLNKKQLARLMMGDHPGRWSNLERARSDVRRATGADKCPGVKAAFEFKSTIEHGIRALKCAVKPVKHYDLAPGQTVGVISDVHLPYHDPLALESALAFLFDRGIDTLLLNGDILDFYGISRFNRDPSAMPVHEELDIGRGFLRAIREQFQGKIVYSIGNHEARLEHYLWSKAPEIAKLEGLTLGEQLHASEYGVDMVDSAAIVRVGAHQNGEFKPYLNIIHGHEFGESTYSPVNPARGLFLRAKCSTLAGHNHQTSEHHENSLNGDSMACWSTGCLCSLEPAYRPFAFTKWNHGFAVVEIETDGKFTVHNHRIIDGKVH